jgi:predicted DNA-binding protein
VASAEEASDRVVATHVLISEEQVVRLRDLSRRTRIAQSEYLREAVDDLLIKYGCLPEQK